jgi:hypothetical protein
LLIVCLLLLNLTYSISEINNLATIELQLLLWLLLLLIDRTDDLVGCVCFGAGLSEAHLRAHAACGPWQLAHLSSDVQSL